MARILASAAGATASGSLGPSWLFGLCVFVVSVWVVSFAVFICGHSHDGDDRPKKKPAPTKKASRVSSRSSGTVVDTSGMYVAAYAGCSGGHHHGGAGCGGGGHHGGGGCGGGGGGGGGGCSGGGGGSGC